MTNYWVFMLLLNIVLLIIGLIFWFPLNIAVNGFAVCLGIVYSAMRYFEGSDD